MASKHQDAPGELETVRAFVNSVDMEGGTEEFRDPEALAGWLAGYGLLEPGTHATTADLRRAVDVREALRALMRANTDGEPAGEARATLRAAAARAKLALEFAPEGSQLAPRADGVDGALGRLLVRVHDAQHDGTWARMKACPWHTCHWAFYDHTKNRSGVWCNMAVCGNRAKAKAYRERHA
ncbi:MAG TPA: CGNR zinc finger domain-containing protein [Solirubrobacteraceae bacterium]|nr:CGNR zinc finger domain-containing protein [Solirubrobacteraceae bacterium]